MDRRVFLSASAGAVIAAGAKAAAPIQIVDTHQHLWDPKRLPVPWIVSGSVFDGPFMQAEYAKATQGLNVVQAVYVEVDVDPKHQKDEAAAVAGWCERSEGVTVAGVISGRPEHEGFKDYITPFRDHKHVRGIRRLLQSAETPAGYAIRDMFIAGVRLLGELGLSFDICIPAERLGDAVKLIDACPGVRFILDHCGCANLAAPDQSDWKRWIDKIADRKHVDCKVSGIIATLPRGKWSAERLAPVVNHVLESFGPDRVAFGGDWPVCLPSATFAEWVGCLRQIVSNRPESEQRRLFADNARRIYRLPIPPS